MRKLRIESKKGHVLVQHGVTIGVVVGALVLMSTGVQRGVQAVLKKTSDLVGIQKDAEQTYDKEVGYLDFVETTTEVDLNTTIDEAPGTLTYTYEDTITTINSKVGSSLGEREP